MLQLPTPRRTRQLTTFDPATGMKVIMVDPGSSAVVGEVSGSGYLAKLWLTFPGWFWAHWEPDRLVDQRILKHVLLRVYVDGADEPQVAAPASDLFGVGLGRPSSFAARWLGMSSGGCYLALPMPFRTSLRIEVENRDPEQRLDLFCNVVYQECELADDVPYLHAAFTTGRHEAADPLPLLELTGRGRYIGCTLACQGEPRNYLSFLEAPEHVWLDGATRPQIVGTGMEDYFLGGWYFRDGPFTGPDHGVPVKDVLDSAVTMYRIHDLDAIWFDSAVRIAFVSPWQPDRLRRFAHSAVAFSYLDRPTAVPAIPATEELWPWYRHLPDDHLSIP